MEAIEVLHIGVGKCGNNFVDGLVRANKDSALVGMLYNTAANDVSTLDTFLEEEVGYVIIPNADGSGANRNLAKQYAIKNMPLFEERIRKYATANNFTFYFSMDGGTGSGCTPELIKYLDENLGYDHTCNVVMAMRSKNLSKAQLENTRACYNEIMELHKQGIIKSIMIIDNDSRKTIEEVNMDAVRDISYSYSFKAADDLGVIDTTDMGNYFNSVGYRTVYTLNSNIDSFEKALEDAIEKSVFLKPDKYVVTEEFKSKLKSDSNFTEQEKNTMLEMENNYKFSCNSLIGLIQTTRYKVEDVLATIKKKLHSKLGENDVNVIGLGGMNIPQYKIKEVISQIKMASFEARTEENNIIFYNEELDDNTEEVQPKTRRRTPVKKKSMSEIFDKNMWKNKR